MILYKKDKLKNSNIDYEIYHKEKNNQINECKTLNIFFKILDDKEKGKKIKNIFKDPNKLISKNKENETDPDFIINEKYGIELVSISFEEGVNQINKRVHKIIKKEIKNFLRYVPKKISITILLSMNKFNTTKSNHINRVLCKIKKIIAKNYKKINNTNNNISIKNINRRITSIQITNCSKEYVYVDNTDMNIRWTENKSDIKKINKKIKNKNKKIKKYLKNVQQIYLLIHTDELGDPLIVSLLDKYKNDLTNSKFNKIFYLDEQLGKFVILKE